MRKRPSSVEDAIARAEHLKFGAMLDERPKIEEEKLRKEEKQKHKVNHPAEESKKRAKKIYSQGPSQFDCWGLLIFEQSRNLLGDDCFAIPSAIPAPCMVQSQAQFKTC